MLEVLKLLGQGQLFSPGFLNGSASSLGIGFVALFFKRALAHSWPLFLAPPLWIICGEYLGICSDNVSVAVSAQL